MSNREGQPGLKWMNVAGLGIAFAISGNFSGWNFGLGLGGWGGMMAASIIMACFYLCLSQCIAEMGAAHPEAQGMDSYAGYGLGRAGSYFAGMSIAIAVGVAAGAGCNFIEAYCEAVAGVGGWPLKIVLIAILIAVQLRGAREAVTLTTVGGLFSVIVLLVFCAAMLPNFSIAGLYTRQLGGATVLPHGTFGILECIPYALFMFFGVEQAANAVGDMHQPTRNLPKALLLAVGVILMLGSAVLILATGGGGIDHVAKADGNPLYVAMSAAKSADYAWLGAAVGAGSIVSLVSTVFSMTYSASRQLYSIAASGLLPARLARTNAKGAPVISLYLVGACALLGTLIDANTVVVCFIFSVSVCNVLVLISFLRLRMTKPTMPRPYRAIGGSATAIAALVLSLAVMGACVNLQSGALVYVVLAYTACALYYLTITRVMQGRVAEPE